MELRKINKIRYNKNPNKKDITGFIDKELVTNGVPKEIIQKVINVESTYNINAVSSTGCSGLMQLCRRVRSMYSNHHLVLNLNPWESNIQMGTLYLSLLHKQFNSWEKALNAYNSGYPHKGYGKTICRQLNIKI
jgi:soluble lytic murein transglycosylase-like protein